VCAKELAKAGVDVALFDHSHPREKPCGVIKSKEGPRIKLQQP
jgi:flavin-dependent dehydrogenase